MQIQTMISTKAANNFGALVEYAIRGGTTIIERYKRPSAVVIGHDEYQRFKALENAVLWQESKRIADENDANDSWVDGEVVEERMRALREMEN